MQDKERADSRLRQGLKAQPEEVITKIKIVGGEDREASKACKTFKSLAQMRTNIDIETIKRLTIDGQIAKIEKNKAIGIKERERVPEKIDDTKVSVNEKANTLKSLLQQRREKTRLYNEENFNSFKVGIHGGKPIPNFYVPPKVGDVKTEEGQEAEQKAQTTVDWYKVDRREKRPSVVSHRQLKRDTKYWAKEDDLYMNEL